MKRAVVLILFLAGYWLYTDSFFFQAKQLSAQLQQVYHLAY